MSTYNKFIIVLGLTALTVLCGCIKNDIPYPRIQANFASFEVEGQIQATGIDSINRSLTVYLDETVDIQSVRLKSFVTTPAGVIWADSAAFAAGIDLSKPVTTTLSLYQDYSWVVSAVQNIERYFTVANQIGASTIDVPGRRVVAYVPMQADITAIEVLTMKLAGPEATYSPEIIGKRIDFTTPFELTVTEHGRSEKWTLYVLQTDASVVLESVDAWTNVAWLHASAEAGRDNGFEYRRADSQEWTEVPDEWVTQSGGAMTARLVGLTPLTTYQARARSDQDYSIEVEFTTEDTYTLPNGTFDDWWLDGKIWCPWIEGGSPYWGTGNKGATTLGSSNTYPTDDTATGSGQAACLETRFVGIGALGKLAAGNLFAGDYVKTDGTNGILDFGRPFTQHPTALRGYYKYTTAPISHTSSGFENLAGRPDSCIIWIALIDSPEPFQIRTNPANRHLFNPDAPDVIAYGSMEVGYDVNNYIPFRIELNYKDTARKPRYMLIVASASKYGDYFTGGNGAKLFIDNFSLDFDY